MTRKELSLGETRLLFRLIAEQHDASETAVKAADERLTEARKRWEETTEVPDGPRPA